MKHGRLSIYDCILPLSLASPALAGGADVHIGLGVPVPGYYVEPPPVVQVQPPVVIEPTPVVVYQPRVIYQQPGYVEYRRPLPPGQAKKHYRHKHKSLPFE